MKDTSKCSRCHRRSTCVLHDLAAQTLPWIVEALRESRGSSWDRAQVIQRLLRGAGGSPGFVEDWVFAGALDSSEVNRMVETILSQGEVDLAVLSRDCRHYQGPALSPLEDAALGL